MRRDNSFQFGLPRFQGAVRQIVLLCVGVWLTFILLTIVYSPAADWLQKWGALNPQDIRAHGRVWQFLTYSFVHTGPWQLLMSLVGIYFIGSAVEERVGQRAFWQLFIGSSVFAGIVGFLLSLTGVVGRGAALGAGAADNALLMVFYLFFQGASILIFPLPFQIPVKWVVVAFGAVEFGYFVLSGYHLFYLVQPLGLAGGYVWYRFAWRRASLLGPIRNPFTDLRNNYYRWKRRRAAKKFQVYMRKHGQDPKEYFDEYGNFRPPDEKKDGGRWIN